MKAVANLRLLSHVTGHNTPVLTCTKPIEKRSYPTTIEIDATNSQSSDKQLPHIGPCCQNLDSRAAILTKCHDTRQERKRCLVKVGAIGGKSGQLSTSRTRVKTASSNTIIFSAVTRGRKNAHPRQRTPLRVAHFTSGHALRQSSAVPTRWHLESADELVKVLGEIQAGILKRRHHPKIGSVVKTDESYPTVFKPSERLPQSPIFRYIAEKDKPFKARPSDEAHTGLSGNPYAKMLASPIRACQATGVRLPRELLVGWNILRHPSRDINALVPTSLSLPEIISPQHPMHLQKIRRDCTTFQTSQDSPKFPGSHDMHFENESVDAQQGQDKDRTSVEPKTSLQVNTSRDEGRDAQRTVKLLKLLGPNDTSSSTDNNNDDSLNKSHWKLHPLYLLPRHSLVNYLTSTFDSNSKKKALDRLTPIRWRAMGITSRELATVNWRSDMPKFVARLMRLRVINAFKSALMHEDVQLLPDTKILHYTYALHGLSEKGALLWIGQQGPNKPMLENRSISVEIKDRSNVIRDVFVLDGPRLLGDKLPTVIDILGSRVGVPLSGLLLLRYNTPQVARLITELWRLNGYIDNHSPISEQFGRLSTLDREAPIKHVILHDVQHHLPILEFAGRTGQIPADSQGD